MASTLVAPETFIRAETDRQFGNVVTMAGGAAHTAQPKLHLTGALPRREAAR